MIKEFVKSENQEDWIDYIIQSLLGTCDSLSEMEEEYTKMGFDVNYLHSSIDENIWCCEKCCWWVEVCETNEDGICEDCDD
jgi:hypothetical protein